MSPWSVFDRPIDWMIFTTIQFQCRIPAGDLEGCAKDLRTNEFCHSALVSTAVLLLLLYSVILRRSQITAREGNNNLMMMMALFMKWGSNLGKWSVVRWCNYTIHCVWVFQGNKTAIHAFSIHIAFHIWMFIPRCGILKIWNSSSWWESDDLRFSTGSICTW